MTVPASACCICGDAVWDYLFRIHQTLIYRCRGCGLTVSQPDGTGGVEYLPADEPVASTTETEAARKYMDEVQRKHPQPGRMLLIAPQFHPLASEAKSRGWTIVSHVTASEWENHPVPFPPADAAVVLFQLEKTERPLEMLQSLRSALPPKGPVLLLTQVLDSWACRFFGNNWIGWRNENRCYWDTHTLQLLLLKSGLGGIWISPDRRRYTWAHVALRAAQAPRTLLTRNIARISKLFGKVLSNSHLTISSSGRMVTCARVTEHSRPMLSIVVPAYNEGQSFPVMMDALLKKEVAGVDREIIVVESNSRDGTREAAVRYAEQAGVRLILQDKPRGKGNAVREGFAAARGDILMIQDADLEYDLDDYDALLEPLLKWRQIFVLGARHGGNWKMRQFAEQKSVAHLMNVGHVIFTTLINVLYGQHMRDPFTMYKVFRRDCLFGLQFECNHFDFDHELVIKLVRKGYRPFELPVNYKSRSYSEGKKVNFFREPLRWLKVDFKCRFIRLRPPSDFSSLSE